MQFKLKEIGYNTLLFSNRSNFISTAPTEQIKNGTIVSDGNVQYIKKDDISVFPDKPGWLPYGLLNPAHFGADYTGINDSTKAFQDVIDYAKGKEIIYCSDGILKINNSVYIRYNNQIIDLRNCIINGSNLPTTPLVAQKTFVFHFEGEPGPHSRTIDKAKKGDKEIIVHDNKDFKAGQIIQIRSQNKWYAENNYRVEMNRILKIEDNKLILEFPLKMDFDDNPNIRFSCTPIKNAHLKGGILQGAGYTGPKANGLGQKGVTFRNFENCSLSNISIKGFQGNQCQPDRGIGFFAKNIYLEGHTFDYNQEIKEGDNSGFYGIFPESVKTILYENIKGYRLRHMIDGSLTSDVLVKDSIAYRSHMAAYSCHSANTDWVFDHCRTEGSYRASLHWRGFNVEVRNCYFETYHFIFYDYYRGDSENALMAYYKFHNNTFISYANRKAIKIALKKVSVEFVNNKYFSIQKNVMMQVQSERVGFILANGNICNNSLLFLRIPYYGLYFKTFININENILQNTPKLLKLRGGNKHVVVLKNNYIASNTGEEIFIDYASKDDDISFSDIHSNYTLGGIFKENAQET